MSAQPNVWEVSMLRAVLVSIVVGVAGFAAGFVAGDASPPVSEVWVFEDGSGVLPSGEMFCVRDGLCEESAW